MTPRSLYLSLLLKTGPADRERVLGRGAGKDVVLQTANKPGENRTQTKKKQKRTNTKARQKEMTKSERTTQESKYTPNHRE